MSSTGIIMNLGVCSRVSRLNFTRESTILNWALANVFEDLDFLSHNYCAQNIIKLQDHQRHRHLNLPLDQNLHLFRQAHQNVEINLM